MNAKQIHVDVDTMYASIKEKDGSRIFLKEGGGTQIKV